MKNNNHSLKVRRKDHQNALQLPDKENKFNIESALGVFNRQNKRPYSRDSTKTKLEDLSDLPDQRKGQLKIKQDINLKHVYEKSSLFDKKIHNLELDPQKYFQDKISNRNSPKSPKTVSTPKNILEDNMKTFFSSKEDQSARQQKQCVDHVMNTTRSQKIVPKDLQSLKSLKMRMPKQKVKEEKLIEPIVTLLPNSMVNKLHLIPSILRADLDHLKSEYGEINQLLQDQKLINRFLLEKLIKDANNFYNENCKYIWSIDSEKIIYTLEDMIPKQIQLLVYDKSNLKVNKKSIYKNINETIKQFNMLQKKDQMLSSPMNKWISNNNETMIINNWQNKTFNKSEKQKDKLYDYWISDKTDEDITVLQYKMLKGNFKKQEIKDELSSIKKYNLSPNKNNNVQQNKVNEQELNAFHKVNNNMININKNNKDFEIQQKLKQQISEDVDIKEEKNQVLNQKTVDIF